MTCDKCDSNEGWIGPRYRSLVFAYNFGTAPVTAVDWLEFTCKTCGYIRKEKMKDYRTLPPIVVEEKPKSRFMRWWSGD